MIKNTIGSAVLKSYVSGYSTEREINDMPATKHIKMFNSNLCSNRVTPFISFNKQKQHSDLVNNIDGLQGMEIGKNFIQKKKHADHGAYLSIDSIQKMLIRIISESKMSQETLASKLQISRHELISLMNGVSEYLIPRINLPLVKLYCSIKFVNPLIDNRRKV